MTLHSPWLGSQRIELAECGSTNDEAARLARGGASHGTIVIARTQRSGRGRDGRVWQSPDGGLYLSAVLRPVMPLVAVPPMTLAIGIGLCDAVRAAGAPCVLKWPNDLLVDGPPCADSAGPSRRKLAGVLVEAQSQGGRLDAVIVGIGINLDGELPDELGAITLTEAAGKLIVREAFVTVLLAHVERWVDRYVAIGLDEIIPAWQERMALGLEARAVVNGAPLIGLVTGLDHDGALLVRDETGCVHRIRSGDVEVARRA